MSKHDFSTDEFAARRARVREAIDAAQLDWLIVFHPVSIHWLTGSDAKSYQSFQCLFVSAKPAPLVIYTRESERNEFEDDALVDEIRGWGGNEPADPLEGFARVAGELGLGSARVGMEVPASYLHPHHYVGVKNRLGGALKAEPSNLVHDLKLVKSPAELAAIRTAAGYADHAMEVFVSELCAGRSELTLAGEVYRALLTAGSGIPASTLNLVSGTRASFSHGGPTGRVLRTGDCGNLEYGATCKRYTATIGRQFSLGPPGERLRELHDIVRAAGDACIAQMRPGVPATVPHAAAKQVIADAGLDAWRIHTTGYGLAPGFPPSWGEPIQLFGGSPYTLEAGMVLSVEPPVFIGPEHIGVRIIDNVLITENGAQILSRHSRDLIVID